MKKFLFIFMAILVASSVSFAVYANNSAEVDGRVKISSPSEIKNFRDIVKRGNDLVGIRLAAMLERISNPGEIKNFENIKKVGTALWGYRRISGSAMVTTEARACVAAAITKKDGAIKNALNSFNSSTNASIDARTSCQLKAITLGSAAEQQSANMSCTASYHTATKANVKSLVTARDNAWNAYKTEIKACGKYNGEIKIEDGGNLESLM